MAIKVTVEKVLSDLWATEEDFATMTDDDIVELLNEDTCEFLDGAKWTVVRTQESVLEQDVAK